jgi:hypothetical protein
LRFARRTQACGFASAPDCAQPFKATLALREKGWVPYRIWFDPEAFAWIAKVIDWGTAA